MAAYIDFVWRTDRAERHQRFEDDLDYDFVLCWQCASFTTYTNVMGLPREASQPETRDASVLVDVFNQDDSVYIRTCYPPLDRLLHVGLCCVV